MSERSLGTRPNQTAGAPLSAVTGSRGVGGGARRVQWLGLPAAIAAGLLLRVLMIGNKSLWLDEVMSLQVTLAGPQAWLTGAAEAYHPPLYYAFLYFWVRLGQSETLLRLSSALFGVLAVPLAYLVARRLRGREVAISVAWLVALSPLLVWYSQEFRSYSLLVFLALLSSLALVQLLERARPLIGWWILYVIATVAAVYTHYDALLLLPIQCALLLVLWAQRRLALGGLAASLAAWPFVVAAFWPWISSPAAANFVDFMWASGGYPGLLLAQTLGVPLPLAFGIISVLTALAILLFFLVWTYVRSHDLWPRLFQSPFLRAIVFVAFVLLIVLSVWPRGYSIKRLLVIVVPFVCIVPAWFWPFSRPLGRPLVSLLLLSAVAASINVVAIPKDQWREAVQYLDAVYQPGDVILIAPSYDNLPLDFYNRGRLPVAAIDTPQQADLLVEGARTGRLWLVYNEPPAGVMSVIPELEQRLSGRFRNADEWSGYRVRIVLFVSK